MAASESRKQEGSEVAINLLAHNAFQLFQRIGFHKGHLPSIDRVNLGLIPIEKNDIQAAIGEDNSQGKTHMATPADNDNLFRFLHELLIASFWMRPMVEL